MKEELLRKIDRRELTVSIVGLGYVGLPLALAFAQEGFKVVGIDIDSKRVESINQGKSYITDVSDEELSHVVSKGRLVAYTNYDVLEHVDAIIIAVPTPLSKTRDPDLTFILNAIEELKGRLRKGHIVVLESTTYPGTTEEIVKPELEASGLLAGRDFFLAFSPERINPGDKRFGLRNTPKVIGGVDRNSTEISAYLYKQIVEQVFVVSDAKTAEMTKLLENTFRAVNIALVNEVAIMCKLLGIDVWEVIEAASTKPFGFMKFTPGPGIGGHCIPVDPIYLSWKMKMLNYNARMIEVASEINTNMPRYVVSLAQDILNERERSVKNSRILILGVAYKKDVGDVRESPALDVMHLLMEKGALVSYHDPYVPKLFLRGTTMKSVELTPDLLEEQDLVILTTDHSCLDLEFIHKHARIILDTKNAFRNFKDKVVKL